MIQLPYDLQNFVTRPAPTIIAEIGCNHMGDLERAKSMIKIAKEQCDVQYAKFQKRNPKELLSETQYQSPHPVPANSYGETYGAHREFLEFTQDHHHELLNYCKTIGIGYSSSVWDMTSAIQITEINPPLIKIGSGTNTHLELVNYLCKNYNGEIHVSLGMTTTEEEKRLIDIFNKHKRLSDLVLYHCTSGYPVPPKDICLLGIKRLVEQYSNSIKGIGFSSHYDGVELDGAAFVLGADYIERHFTLDKNWKGTDHSASLDPEELKFVRDSTKIVAESLTFKTKEVMDIEVSNREKLKYIP